MTFSLRTLAGWLDDRCRIFDMKVQRFHDNLLSPLGVKRENIEAFIWPSVIAAALWTGMPTIDIRQLIGAVVGLCIFVILVVINRKSKNPLQDLCAQIGLLFALAGFIWFFGAEEIGRAHV